MADVLQKQLHYSCAQASAFPLTMLKNAPGRVSSTRVAQRGVNPHAPYVHPSFPAPPACSAELGRGRAPLHPLSVLPCCTAGKAQPVLAWARSLQPLQRLKPRQHTSSVVPENTRDCLELPDFKHKEISSSSPSPLGAHQTSQFIVQHLSHETGAGSGITAVPPSSPRSHQLGATSSPIAHPTGPDGCHCHLPDVCPHGPLYLLHPEQVQTTTRVTGFAFHPFHPFPSFGRSKAQTGIFTLQIRCLIPFF